MIGQICRIGEKRPMNAKLTKLSYELAGTIYRSPLPGSPLFDPEHQLLDVYIDKGVNTIVMLTPEDEARELTGMDLRARYESLGFDVIYAPIPDFDIPDPGALQKPIQGTLLAAHAGKTIVVHCHAGLGRTGIFASCLAKVVFNMTGEEAVAWVRQYIPHAVENNLQYQFVKNFEY